MIFYKLNDAILRRVLFPQNAMHIRGLFGRNKPLIQPPPALKQVTLKPDIKGHLKYERYWSNNGKYVPQIKQGDTFGRAIFGNFKENYELFPFFFLGATYCIVTALTFYLTGKTIEGAKVVTNTVLVGNPDAKAWRIVRDKYWKYFITLYDIFGVTRTRFPLMEQLLDEIEEASEKRRLEDERREESIRQFEEEYKLKENAHKQ